MGAYFAECFPGSGSMKRLIYLSHSLIRPGGMTDPFLMVEQPWLNQHFDRVDLVGEDGTAVLDASAAGGIRLQRSRSAGFKAAALLFLRPEVWQEIGHLFCRHKLTPGNLKRLLFFAWRGLRMWLNARPLLDDGDATLYSFWLSFDGYAAALCHRSRPNLRLVMRGHAFDVDPERTALNPYLMKRLMAREADGIYLISQTAKKQLMSYMEGHIAPEKVHVLAMGSAGKPPETLLAAPRFSQGVLKVVSCASILPIKQIEVLVEALSRWEGMPLSWLHIGGGPELQALQTLADEKLSRKENVIVEFAGTMNAPDVNALYEMQTFDVFINTSKREGVPVSIMEAMRCGIPAIAPRVGGIPELVVPGTGFLYEPEKGADGVLEALQKLCSMNQETTEQMRRTASAHWQQHYCTHTLLPTLFPETRA